MKQRILIIEDDPRDAEINKHKLAGKFDVFIASSLKLGVLALERNNYDLVLLDLNLINGKRDEVIDKVKAAFKGPIVVLTGDSNPRTKDLSLLKDVDGFAVKNIDDTAADLVWIIHQALYRAKK